MCLIIAPGTDGKPALLPRDVFDYAYNRNDDGYGGMYVEDGRVKHFKTLGLTADEEYSHMEEMVERHPDIIFHMRYKTHGKVMPSLCHPFRILHKNRHGKDLFFMHNGVMSEFGKNLTFGQSDTTKFKDTILIPLLTRNPDALDDPDTWAAIERLTVGSRLIFLDSDGKVYRTSNHSWNARYGLTLSNTYMLPSESSITYVGGNINTRAPKEYPEMRRIVKGNVSYIKYCRMVKPGYLRTEDGELYKDCPASEGITINYERGFIPSEDEFEVLLSDEGEAKEYEPTDKDLKELQDELDDDVPEFPLLVEDKNTAHSDSKRYEEQLRYARLVHNTHAGRVACREQLLSDIFATGDEELVDLCREDAETSATIIAELFEIILEMNDIVSEMKDEATDEPLGFNMDNLLEFSKHENHKEGIDRISLMRRVIYEQELALKTEDAKRRITEAHEKAWGKDEEDEKTSAYA